MSYQEKRTIVSTLTGIAILVAYCIYVNLKQRAGEIASGDIKFWAGTMLLFIGIGIIANIMIQIIFHILLSIFIAVKKTVQNETVEGKEIDKAINVEMVEDEMDRLIGLKSMKISFFFAGLGFVAGLVLLVMNFSVVIVLNVLFVSFSAGSLLEGFSQLYYYRRGVHNG